MILTGREPHPVLPLLDPEIEKALMATDPAKVAEYYSLRAEALRMEAADPLRYGYDERSSDIWRKANDQKAELRKQFPVGVIEELDLGGNRAMKTERAAKEMVRILVEKPGAKVWFLQSTQTISRQSQQPIVWKYLPPEWKPVSGRSKRDLTTKINYTQAGGFTEDTFVLPNGSQGFFKFYSVSVADMEGPELDAAWADELVTPEWLEFLRYRLVTRNGYLLTTFTPVEGYTATVKSYLDNAKTIEEVDAELLPIRDEKGDVKAFEKVPRVQKSGIERARIVYFHTADNPYGNYPSMRETLKGKSRETILMRAYGVPSKTFGAAFPMFRYNVHVITVEQWMQIQKRFPNGSRYHLIDPCSGRNWFQAWVMCIPGKKIIYREWPSHGHLGAYIQGIGDPGAWAISGKAVDGEKGPAQTSFGFGLLRYKQEIEKLEGGEVIQDRYMDARTANSPTATREGTTTLIEQMAELDMNFLGASAEKNVFSKDGDGSIDMLNSALYYDLETPLGQYSPSMSRINEPELQIVETCPNMIYSFSNWTGVDGQHGASKDPIDVARMIVLNELDYIDEKMLAPRQPWQQQFGKAA